MWYVGNDGEAEQGEGVAVKPTNPRRSVGRNIIICCDGTSNEPVLGDDNLAGMTNVVHMFRCLEKDDKQIVFYEPGVGTNGILDLWHRRTDRAKAIAAQATGYGLDDHVTAAYKFLCENYRPGDRIALFGFSRGAYTARVIAGMVMLIGILRPEQCNLADYALKAYKLSSEVDDLSVGWRFARATGSRRAPIYFMGLWDTVGSMIAPLKDRIGLGLRHLPYTGTNPAVARIRHAMAIDERRRMFRPSRWQATPYTLNPKTGAKGRPQDIKEVWFAGDHADIGGGHPEIEAGLSKLSLRWMAGEAHAAGLRVNKSMLTRVTTRKLDSKGRVVYCAEDPVAKVHAQPKGFWKILEYIPKDAGLREWSARRKLFGKYLPAGEPRPVEPGAFIHESVARRMATGYAPVNLGKGADIYRIAANEAVGGRPRK